MRETRTSLEEADDEMRRDGMGTEFDVEGGVGA